MKHYTAKFIYKETFKPLGMLTGLDLQKAVDKPFLFEDCDFTYILKFNYV